VVPAETTVCRLTLFHATARLNLERSPPRLTANDGSMVVQRTASLAPTSRPLTEPLQTTVPCDSELAALPVHVR